MVDPSGMNQTNKFCSPEIELPCVGAAVDFSSTLRSPAALLFPCEFLPLWFLAISNAFAPAADAKT